MLEDIFYIQKKEIIIMIIPLFHYFYLTVNNPIDKGIDLVIFLSEKNKNYFSIIILFCFFDL